MKAGFRESSITGFTLLEVLIAVVVLSIGLIGLAALMIQGQKFNRSALHRSQATFIAYDMSDRMRANRAGDYTGDPTQNAACLGTGGCAAAAMAGHDLFEWNNIITAVLPAGQGTVCDRVATPCGTTPFAPANTEFDITVSWTEADTQGNPQVRNYVLRLRP